MKQIVSDSGIPSRFFCRSEYMIHPFGDFLTSTQAAFGMNIPEINPGSTGKMAAFLSLSLTLAIVIVMMFQFHHRMKLNRRNVLRSQPWLPTSAPSKAGQAEVLGKVVRLPGSRRATLGSEEDRKRTEYVEDKQEQKPTEQHETENVDS